jgi:hypothetical protein
MLSHGSIINGLDRLFYGLWGDASTVDAAVTLSSAFAAHSRIYLHSVSDVSLLSVDELDSLLSSESFIVDSEDALLQLLFRLGHPSLLRHIRWVFVSVAAIASLCDDLTLFMPTESLWLVVADRLLHPSTTGVYSLIVSDFPPLFEEFPAKRFNLLWRGSRDGFTAEEFHRRCDGRANTLTLILDIDGNVFGGFTPVKWESSDPGDRFGHFRSDENLQSFLFTLGNPHSVPPQKFALKAEKKHDAIFCRSDGGPDFGGCDICVKDNCNANRNSCARFGTRQSNSAYANDTTIKDFFTGAEYFTVKEIAD